MSRVRRLILTGIGVLVIGTAIIFGSFAVFGFPFPSEPAPYLLWVKLVVLVVILGFPFVTSKFYR